MESEILSIETIEKIKNLNNKLDKAEEKLNNIKNKLDKAIDILGEYKYYSMPTEEQNKNNEHLVEKAYETLTSKIEKRYEKQDNQQGYNEDETL